MFLRLLSLGGFLLMTLNVQAQDYVPGEVIVKFRDSQPSSSPQFSSKAVGMTLQVKKSWDVLNTHKFQMKAGQEQNIDQVLNALREDPSVEYAEPNYILKKLSFGIEGEPIDRDQALAEKSQSIAAKGSNTLFSGGSNYFQSNADIQVVNAWSAMNPAPTFIPVVAIIDTGVDYTHEVFVDSGSIWLNSGEIASNGIDDDGNGYIDDVRGWNFVSNSNDPMDDENHGTHVAGIVLGATQDIFANPITAARIKIMPLKFLDSNGSGSTSDAIEAIYYAINNGANIINASWGGGSYSTALIDALIATYNAKVSFIAAAGNSSLNNDQNPTYPANYGVPNVVSISASSDFDMMASFSNYGKQTVHISSPGVSILSAIPGDSYGYSSGTSMAAPLAAGLVALLQNEEGKNINGYQVNAILASQNDSGVGDLTGKVITDARVNVLKSLNHVQSVSVSDDQPAFDSTMLRNLASAGSSESAGGCGLVKEVMNNKMGKGVSTRSLPFSKALLMLLVLSPFAMLMAARQSRKEIDNRRQHERFEIDSQVKINVGSRELVGQVSCISVGGAQINTEELLESGGIIEMNIMSPDGKSKVQAVGKVVWSSEKKAYGVKFCGIEQDDSSTIAGWTKKLVKSS